MLTFIENRTGINFTQDTDLILSLCMHIIPLKQRTKINMQLQNSMVDQIKTDFALAYEIAIIAACFYANTMNFQLSEDEIGYLAVHFIIALDKKDRFTERKRILVICSSRRGNSMLIKWNLMKRFGSLINSLFKSVLEYEQAVSNAMMSSSQPFSTTRESRGMRLKSIIFWMNLIICGLKKH